MTPETVVVLALVVIFAVIFGGLLVVGEICDHWGDKEDP